MPADPRVLSLDVQYDDALAHIGAHLGTLGGAGLLEVTAAYPNPAPYVPGAFARREGPVLIAMARALAGRGEGFDLVLIDGHGTAHPHRFGLACFVGYALDVPTVGIAKDTLVRYRGELDEPRGSTLPVEVSGETVGWVVRTCDGVRPLYASPGHRVSVAGARDWALRLPSSYRISEPQRAADQLARARARGEPAAVDLGVLQSSSSDGAIIDKSNKASE